MTAIGAARTLTLAMPRGKRSDDAGDFYLCKLVKRNTDLLSAKLATATVSILPPTRPDEMSPSSLIVIEVFHDQPMPLCLFCIPK